MNANVLQDTQCQTESFPNKACVYNAMQARTVRQTVPHSALSALLVPFPTNQQPQFAHYVIQARITVSPKPPVAQHAP